MTADAGDGRRRVLLRFAVLAETFVLVVLAFPVIGFAVGKAEVVIGGEWCESESPDGAYAVKASKKASSTVDGVPLDVTVSRRASDGGSDGVAEFTAYVDARHESAA